MAIEFGNVWSEKSNDKNFIFFFYKSFKIFVLRKAGLLTPHKMRQI